MAKLQKRISKEEADFIGINFKGAEKNNPNHNKKHSVSKEQWLDIIDFRCTGVASSSGSKSNEYKNKKSTDPDGRKVLMSSWNHAKGQNMGIEEYCEKYNLPYEYLTSWKAVTHTGTPYYNVVFKTVSEMIEEDLTEDFITECILKYVKPLKVESSQTRVVGNFDSDNIDRLIYSDVHIGLDPNGDRKVALYPRDWNRKEIIETLDNMIAYTLANQTGPTLIIDELGDFMDGWDGKTTRKGHDLPQCMTNEEAFDVGLEFKIRLVQRLAPFYDTIICNNVCEDNHAGAFGYVVNKAFKSVIELQFPSKVTVFNRREFITHYDIGKHVFVLCHGKDATHLKFGFKPHLDPKQSEKIDQYLKHKGVYKLGGRIEFSKGDSHQLLFDMASSDDFEYMNYPALSPSSDWVQVNFKKGRRGFVLQHLNNKNEKKIINTKFLK